MSECVLWKSYTTCVCQNVCCGSRIIRVYVRMCSVEVVHYVCMPECVLWKSYTTCVCQNVFCGSRTLRVYVRMCSVEVVHYVSMSICKVNVCK